jgi:hypothetical protein
MTSDQENLLLTIARVLRAKIAGEQVGDLAALDKALRPFGPIGAAPTNLRPMADVYRDIFPGSRS